MVCWLFSCLKLPKRRHRMNLDAHKSPVHVLGKQAPSVLPPQHNVSIPDSEMNLLYRAARYPSNQHKLAVKIFDQELDIDADNALHSSKKKGGKMLEARDIALENVHVNRGGGFVRDQDTQIWPPFANDGAGNESLEHVSVCKSVINKPLEDCLNVDDSCNQLPTIATYATRTPSEYKHCNMRMVQKNASCMHLDGLSRCLYALSPSSSLLSSECGNGEPTVMENLHGENMANSDSDVESQLDISLSWANFTSRESWTLTKSVCEKSPIYLNAYTLRQESIIEGENGMFSDTRSISSIHSTECPFDSLELRMTDPLQHQASRVKAMVLEPSISVAGLQKGVGLSLVSNEKSDIFMQEGTWSQTEMAMILPTGNRSSDDGDLFSSENNSNEFVDDATHKDSVSLILSQSGTTTPPVGDLQPNNKGLSLTQICECEDDAASKEEPTISMPDQMLGHLPLPVTNIQLQQPDQLSIQTLQHSHQAISKDMDQMTRLHQTFSSLPDRPSANVVKLYNIVEDRPILGTVAAHWSHSTSTPKWWDGKGIPNSTNKYKEDQKVSWHATPFEVRLEQALAKQDCMLLP